MRKIVLAAMAFLPWGGQAGATPKDDWSKATSAFLASIASGNDAQVEQAADRVAADNSVRAVDFLLKPLRMNPQPGIYWAIISGLSKITDAKALDAITMEVLKGKSPELRRDLIMALRLCDSAGVVEPLLRILKEGTPEIQVSALDELVDRGHLSVVPVLIELAERDPKEDKELNRRFFKAIKALVKEEPEGSPAGWRTWWAKKTGVANPASDPEATKRKPGTTVVETVRRTRATDYEQLKSQRKEDLVVVQGANDAVEDVLFRLEIPHSAVSSERIDRPQELGLDKAYALFVNCGTADFPPKATDRIRQFVEKGGYLFVTDVGISNVVKRAFPGYIDLNRGSLPDLTLEILPWKGSTGHPLLRGVDTPLTGRGADRGQGGKGRLLWVVDAGGPTIGFDPKRVVPLVEAPELAARKKPTAVAVTFLYGGDAKVVTEGIGFGGLYEEFERTEGGRVVCVLSHFKKQRGEDGFTLENILLNFVLEAKDRSLMRDAKKPEKHPEKKP